MMFPQERVKKALWTKQHHLRAEQRRESPEETQEEQRLKVRREWQHQKWEGVSKRNVPDAEPRER